MNAKRVTLRAYSAEVALATKAGSLGEGGYASAGFAEVCEDATAVKPWSFTRSFLQRCGGKPVIQFCLYRVSDIQDLASETAAQKLHQKSGITVWYWYCENQEFLFFA